MRKFGISPPPFPASHRSSPSIPTNPRWPLAAHGRAPSDGAALASSRTQRRPDGTSDHGSIRVRRCARTPPAGQHQAPCARAFASWAPMHAAHVLMARPVPSRCAGLPAQTAVGWPPLLPPPPLPSPRRRCRCLPTPLAAACPRSQYTWIFVCATFLAVFVAYGAWRAGKRGRHVHAFITGTSRGIFARLPPPAELPCLTHCSLLTPPHAPPVSQALAR